MKHSSFFKQIPLLCSDQWKPSFPANPQRSAISTSALQQWSILFLFLVAGQPAAAGHLRGAPAEQAQALPDHAAAVWQRHLSWDRRQCPKPSARPCGKPKIKIWSCYFICFYDFNEYFSSVSLKEFNSDHWGVSLPASGSYQLPLTAICYPFPQGRHMLPIFV